MSRFLGLNLTRDIRDAYEAPLTEEYIKARKELNSSSGIAAGCLPNGRTAHSRFKLPLDHNTSLVCDVPKQGGLAALLKETSLIIWDGAPMAHKANTQALDTLLRDLCDPGTIFGGKVVVLGSDFRQILPVLPQKTQI